MKKTTRQYWTIVYSCDELGMHESDEPVAPNESPDGLLVFTTKQAALESVQYHMELYGLQCHVVPLGRERRVR